MCDCTHVSACGWCAPNSTTSTLVAFCMAVTTASVGTSTSGADACVNRGGVWSVGPIASCTPVTTTTTVPPTTTSGGTTTTTSDACPNVVGLCDCTRSTACGLCQFNSTSASTSTSVCHLRAATATNNNETGEAYCHRVMGIWTIGPVSTCTPPPTTTTTSGSGTTSGSDYRACAYTSLCDCVNDTTCGYCKWATAQKCSTLVGTSTVPGGPDWCHSEGGNWTTSGDSCTNPSTTSYTATVTGVINGVLDVNLTDTVAQVVQNIIAKKLGIDPSAVEVTVATTTNPDGTTSFTLTVKVGSGTISGLAFNNIDNVTGTELEQALSSNGVNTKSGSVNIQSNNSNFAGKIVISVILGLLALFI